MYYQVNDELIFLDFNPVVTVKVYGKDHYYMVELREYKKNQDSSYWLESIMHSNGEKTFVPFFFCGIEFFYDFEINIFKFVDGVGVIKIFTHRFNDSGKLVQFNLKTDSLEEAELWNEKILEYQKTHNCKTFVVSKFESINQSHNYYYNTNGINPYKTYNIGRFPKVSKDFKSIDPRTPNQIMLGYWKKMWSYQHPRNWKTLSSEEIVTDILGL